MNEFQNDDNFVMMRTESRTLDNSKSDINHNLRIGKVGRKSVVNNNNNYIYFNDKTHKLTEHKSKVIKKKLTSRFAISRREHSRLFYKNKKYSLNKKRTMSLSEGGLFFGSKINDEYKKNPKKVWTLAVKTIKEYCKQLNTKLHYIVLHRDEAGNIHFHFYTNAYNSKAQSINIKAEKHRGKLLQDLSEKYFKELGFKRGVPKDITKAAHLKVKDFKEKQDALKKLDNTIKDKENQIDLLNRTIDSLKSQINHVALDIIKLGEITEGQKILDLLIRYSKNDNVKKLKYLSSKAIKTVTKVNKNNIKKLKPIM